MTDALSIGELARRTGRSLDTLRWYEREGLIPGVARDGGGRRRYRPAHVGWLRFLARLRRTGMSIAQLRRYAELTAAGGRSAATREAMLRDHAATVDAQIDALVEARTVLHAKIAFYAEWTRTGRRPPEPDIPA